MYRLSFFLIIIALWLFPHSFACASDVLDVAGALKNRKVMGVIYFKNDSMRLSKIQRSEIDRIASLIATQYSPDKIVRVEGFTSKRERRTDPLTTSLSRAKSVWYYLEKLDSFNSSNLYLTGFNTQQSISKLQGERVEIAIYENPFNEKKEIYSSN
jgi:outer membrane protein OmpA-like peptidoglycan-associated protein